MTRATGTTELRPSAGTAQGTAPGTAQGRPAVAADHVPAGNRRTGAPVESTQVASARAHDVLDVASWWSAQPRPRLSLPVAPCPLPGRGRAGTGVRVALLAAPVDRSHPDLRGALVRTWSGLRCPELPAPGAPDGGVARATALATLLVGQGAAQVRGLVPGAELLAAPVVDCEGEWSDDVVARAVRWAVAAGAEVLVLPFGRLHLGRRVATTVRAAVGAGVRVFAAAGDLGPEVLAFPSAVTGVTAVTGHDAVGLLPGCSLRADLAAPGRDVPASGPTGPLLLGGTGVAAVLATGSHAARAGAARRPVRP